MWINTFTKIWTARFAFWKKCEHVFLYDLFRFAIWNKMKIRAPFRNLDGQKSFEVSTYEVSITYKSKNFSTQKRGKRQTEVANIIYLWLKNFIMGIVGIILQHSPLFYKQGNMRFPKKNAFLTNSRVKIWIWAPCYIPGAQVKQQKLSCGTRTPGTYLGAHIHMFRIKRIKIS